MLAALGKHVLKRNPQNTPSIFLYIIQTAIDRLTQLRQTGQKPSVVFIQQILKCLWQKELLQSIYSPGLPGIVANNHSIPRK